MSVNSTRTEAGLDLGSAALAETTAATQRHTPTQTARFMEGSRAAGRAAEDTRNRREAVSGWRLVRTERQPPLSYLWNRLVDDVRISAFCTGGFAGPRGE